MRIMKWLVAILTVSFTLGGCGKDDKDKKDNPPPTTNQNEPANAADYEKVNAGVSTFVKKQEVWSGMTYGAGDVKVNWDVDTKAMKQAGVSDQTIQEVQEFYSSLRYQSFNGPTYGDADGYQYSYGKVKYAAKAVKWIGSNWNKILNKLPAPVRKVVDKWIKINILMGLLDKYLQVSDKIEDVLTKAINAIFPWWMEWATPGIVWAITLAIPVL